MTAVVQFAQVSSLNTTFFFPWGFCALFGLFTNDHCLALILLSPVKGRKASWFPLTPLYTEAQESLNYPLSLKYIAFCHRAQTQPLGTQFLNEALV